MIALTRVWPRNWSRTRTQAVIVPTTALIAATTNAVTRLSSSAETAPELETTFQKLVAPSRRDSQTSAAIGSITTADRKAVTKPSERAFCALSPEIRARGAAAAVGAALASRAPDRLLDPDHQPAVRVKPALADLAPA